MNEIYVILLALVVLYWVISDAIKRYHSKIEEEIDRVISLVDESQFRVQKRLNKIEESTQVIRLFDVEPKMTSLLYDLDFAINQIGIKSREVDLLELRELSSLANDSPNAEEYKASQEMKEAVVRLCAVRIEVNILRENLFSMKKLFRDYLSGKIEYEDFSAAVVVDERVRQIDSYMIYTSTFFSRSEVVPSELRNEFEREYATYQKRWKSNKWTQRLEDLQRIKETYFDYSDLF